MENGKPPGPERSRVLRAIAGLSSGHRPAELPGRLQTFALATWFPLGGGVDLGPLSNTALFIARSPSGACDLPAAQSASSIQAVSLLLTPGKLCWGSRGWLRLSDTALTPHRKNDVT